MASTDLDAPWSHADMAHGLVKALGQDVRWVPDLRGGELVWFGEGRWHGEPGCHAHVVALMGNLIIAQARALRLTPRAYKEMTNSGFRHGSIGSIIELHQELHRPLDQWDTRRTDLQTLQSVWDLETGVRRDTRRDDYNLDHARVEPDANGPRAMFDGVLANCFAGCPDDLAFFLDRIGSAANGYNEGQKFNWIIGEANAGKSTLITVIARLLGSYARFANSAVVVTPPGTRGLDGQVQRFHLATYARKRMLVFDEAPARGKLNAVVFKALANGSETPVEDKGVRPDEARFIASPFLITNRVIEGSLDGEDGLSIRRRLALICADGLPPEVLIDQLTDLIVEEEGPAVLAWLIEQAHRHHEARGILGQGAPPMSDKARDIVEGFTEGGTGLAEQAWINERLDRTGASGDTLRSTDMWEDFNSWWSARPGQLETPTSSVNFFRQIRVLLEREGIVWHALVDSGVEGANRVKGYRGVRWK